MSSNKHISFWKTIPEKTKKLALIAYENEQEDILISLANKHNVKLNTIKRNIRKYRSELNKHEIKQEKELESEIDKEFQYQETIKRNADGSIFSDRLIDMSEEESRSPQRLLELHNLDPEEFELTYVRNNLWHMPSGGGAKTICYQSRITAKPKKFVWNEKTINKIIDSIQIKDFGFSKPKQYEKNSEAFILPIADLHYGLFATLGACDNEYNPQLAEDYANQVIDKTKSKVEDRKFDKIIYVLGNDFLNSDNLNNTTTRGTPQDNYGFWYDLMDGATELIIKTTNSLLEVAPIDIVYVPSNHDEHSMYSIMKIVDAAFKEEKNVMVDSSPLDRKYKRFGNSLFGFTHDIRKTDALKLMTVEAKEYWSECNYFYWFAAHLHRQMIYEQEGHLEIHRFSTVSGVSRWSYKKGFINPDKKTQCFIADKKYGITETMKITID